MQTLITVVHVFTCILLVLVVLIQSGKGAEISTSFGGSSQTVFGSSGGANFFTRFTSGLATVFMVTSVVLTLLGGQSRKSLFELTPMSSGPTAPAAQQQTAPVDSQAAPVGEKVAPSAADPTDVTPPAAKGETSGSTSAE